MELTSLGKKLRLLEWACFVGGGTVEDEPRPVVIAYPCAVVVVNLKL
jgi:hypothetical protein